MAIQNSQNRFGPIKWIVNQTAGQGTHTTISAAITAASSGDNILVYPGVYTENLTLKAGVNIVGWTGDGNTFGASFYGPQLVGKMTASFTNGSCSICNLELQTNSDNILSASSSTGLVELEGCYINVTNATGISVSGGSVFIQSCFGTTAVGQKFFDITSGGMSLVYSDIFSTPSSITQCTNSGGSFSVNYSTFAQPINVTAGTLQGQFSVFSNTGATLLTISTTTACTFTKCYLRSGSQTTISAASGTSVILNDCFIDSSSGTPVSSAGTVTGLATNGQLPIGNTGHNPTNATLTQGNGMSISNAAGSITLATAAPYPGQSTNTAPGSGFIGQLITANNSSVALTSSTPANITSISLTAGIWDVCAQVSLQAGTVAGTTLFQGVIGLTSAVMTAVGENGGGTVNPIVLSSTNSCGFSIGPTRVSLSSTTSVFLNINAGASVTFSSVTGGGIIRAVRVS